MKTIKAVRAYKLMQSIRPKAMDGDSQMKYIKIMRVLRPVAENYDKDLEDGKNALQDEKFEEMQQKATKHNEAIQAKKNEGLLSFSELKELNDYFADYDKSVKKLLADLGDEEVTLSLGKISEEAFKKLAESIEVSGDDLIVLSDVILE